MMRFQALLFVLLVTAAFVNRAAAQQHGPVATDKPSVKAPAAEKPMSIFNEKIRRYRFELDEMPITVETAEEFMVLHQPRNEPPIIGAYADSETNALVVVGPPEAEQPVRETLAKWMVQRQAGGLPSMNVHKRTLEFRRQKLLYAMASVEMQIVEAAGEKAKQHRDRLQAVEDELTVVEKQIEVVNKYVERLRRSGAPAVSQTGILATENSAPSNAR
jgi:hypothetical protein